MLISHRHPFIWTKTFSTGGTPVESYGRFPAETAAA